MMTRGETAVSDLALLMLVQCNRKHVPGFTQLVSSEEELRSANMLYKEYCL